MGLAQVLAVQVDFWSGDKLESISWCTIATPPLLLLASTFKTFQPCVALSYHRCNMLTTVAVYKLSWCISLAGYLLLSKVKWNSSFDKFQYALAKSCYCVSRFQDLRPCASVQELLHRCDVRAIFWNFGLLQPPLVLVHSGAKKQQCSWEINRDPRHSQFKLFRIV